MRDRPPADLPPDPFGRSKAPPSFDREGRIRLLAEAFDALVDGREVPRAAALFLGGAGMAWLQNGGRVGALEREYLRVAQPERSRMTPARVWRRLQQAEDSGCARTATRDEEPATVAPETMEHQAP